jgi:hypothetical protein
MRVQGRAVAAPPIFVHLDQERLVFLKNGLVIENRGPQPNLNEVIYTWSIATG